MSIIVKIQAIFCKKFTQSLDAFGFIHYLCTDISQGRTFLGGQAKLGSFTIFGGAFVIFSDPKTLILGKYRRRSFQ